MSSGGGFDQTDKISQLQEDSFQLSTAQLSIPREIDWSAYDSHGVLLSSLTEMCETDACRQTQGHCRI